MPISKQKDQEGFIQAIPEQEAAPEIDTGDIFQSAFENENSFVSWAANGFSFGQDFQAVEGYDPFNDIQGYELFSDSFIESDSPQQTAHIKNQLDREVENQKVLSEGGITSVAAQMAAGVTDPIYLPFMLLGIGQVKAGYSAGKAAGVTAIASGASEVPAEIAKHATQEARTLDESLFNIGGATIFAGVIGGGLQKLSKADFKMQSDNMDALMADTSPRSAGAAEVKNISDSEVEVVGVGKLEKIRVSPNVRLATSMSKSAKLTNSSLLESSIVLKGAEKGKTAIPEGGAVETRIKFHDARLGESLESMKGFYKDYRQGMGAGKRIVNDVLLQNRKGQLTPTAFQEEVGKAMRRGDTHNIPEVEKAAKHFRKTVFDPLKNRAIDEGLLPEGVDTATATSYLTRVYNHKKIIAKRDEWDKTLFDWFAGIRQKNQFDLDLRLKDGKEPPVSMREQAGVTDAQIQEAIDSITNNIMGNASGRLPYDVKATVRGPLKERVLNIPDEKIEDFLESDIDLVARQYTMTIGPDIELTRAYGSVDMEAEIQAIQGDYKKMIDKATTEKQRDKLNRLMKSDITDVESVRDMLRGTHKMPDNPDHFAIRAGKNLRAFNFLRMLGGMTVSAIPDMARPVAVNGLMPVANGLKTLATSPQTFNMARKEAKRMAVGLDMVLNSRASSLADISDIYARGSKLERTLRGASDTFGKVTLMSQWNASMKQFAGVVTQDRILNEVGKWASGKVSKAGMKRLAASGIDEGLAKRIAQQFDAHGSTGDLNIANGSAWDDLGAYEALQAAILKDVDRTILTPGVGEKPLWTTGETGKLIFQFKTFAATAHHKVLIADLQYRDAAALNGFLMATALGTLTYGLKQYTAGREIETEPEKLIIESLDRSGAFGYFWDVNNMVEKLTRGEVGVNAMAGASPMSRYVSRNAVGAALGPSFGTAQDIFQVSGALSTGEFTESDVRKVRKLLPAQNLFYMRWLLDSLEEKTAKELGVKK
jgi:hypothetical protein